MDKLRDLPAHTWLTWGASAYGVYCLSLVASTKRKAVALTALYFTAAITGNAMYKAKHLDSSY